MNALIGVSPLLLLVVAGLSIMVIDAFAEDRTELALVTAASLFVAATVAGVLMLGPEITTAPEALTRYLAVDRMGLFFDVVICVGAGLSALLAKRQK